jgi:hypothetical protein
MKLGVLKPMPVLARTATMSAMTIASTTPLMMVPLMVDSGFITTSRWERMPSSFR